MDLMCKKKRIRAVWFAGAFSALLLFLLPCVMVTPIKTNGKWRFVERTGSESFEWLTALVLLFLVVSLICFAIGVIRTRFAFERMEHHKLGIYEVCYVFSWIIFIMFITLSVRGWASTNDLQLELAFLLVPLALFRKNLSLIGFRKQSFTWHIIGVILLCYGVFYLSDRGAGWVMNFLTVDMYSAREEMIAASLRESLGKGQWFSLISEMAAISLVGPLWEEVLFRGLVQTYFMRKMRATLAIILSALLFSMAHGDPSLTLSLFLSGIILGALYVYTKNLWSSILLHILNNTVCTILTVFFPSI